MNFDIRKLDEAIQEAQKTLEELRKRHRECDEASEPHKLAAKIHDRNCRRYLVSCEWDQETYDGVADWNAKEHRSYLHTAHTMLEVSDYETIVKIIELL